MWWSKPVRTLSTLPALTIGAAVLALAGCASQAPDGFKARAVLPTEHYAPKVEEAPDQVALAVHAEGVSAAQSAALADFTARWRTAGSGPIVISAPADAARMEEARSMAYRVQSSLQALGVPSERIRLASYMAGEPKGPILASFTKVVAVGPDCSGGWDNLTSTNSNEPYNHFGCALVANMAAQIADPRDLVAPPALAPGDNSRREVVLGKYRDGKTTASDKDDQASGAISSAVKQ